MLSDRYNKSIRELSDTDDTSVGTPFSHIDGRTTPDRAIYAQIPE
jgi:hypothetical protein